MKKTRTLPTCSLCIFLAMLFVFYCFPVGAVSFSGAAAEESANGAAQLDPLSMGGAFEVTELREENVKHFRLPDGSFVAAQYESAVHYRDTLGAWQDIDNTLALSGGAYVTENGFSVLFPQKMMAGIPLLAIDDGTHSFSFSLEENVKRTTATVENPTAPSVTTGSYRELSTLHKLTSSVRYTDIMEGVDIEYVLVGDRIYENIILKDDTAESAYTFRLSMEGLTLETENGGALVLADSESGEEVFTIPASFMVDSGTPDASTAAARYSDDVSYTLTYAGNDVLLTISASEDFLSDSSRVYPVTIDPPIGTGGTESSEDTYISSAAPYDIAGSASDLYVGRFADASNVTQETKTFWKATSFPTLPAGAAIVGAYLLMEEISFEAEENEFGGVIDPAIVTASLLGASFNENTTNWQSAPSTEGMILDYAYRPAAEGDDYIWSWDISKAVEGWMSGELENYGVCLSMHGSTRNYVGFYSSETWSGSVPTLQINYRSALGVDSLYSYTSISTAAGTAYIGDAMGSVTIVTPTVSSGSTLWNYTPTVTYRSQRAEHFYLAEFEDGETLPLAVGAGFMADFEETLHTVYIDGTQGTAAKDYLVYIDGDGTEHYFERESTTVFREEYDPSLWVERISGGVNYYKLHSDKDGGYTVFTEAGKLQKRVDANGNALRFYYENGFVSSVALIPAGKNEETDAVTLLTVTYEGGQLDKITSVATGDVFEIDYTMVGTVSTVQRMLWDEGGAYFTFDTSSGRTLLSSVSELTEYGREAWIMSYDETGVFFAYDGKGSVKRVTTFAYDEGLYTAGQTISVSRSVGETVYRMAGADDIHGNADDLLTTYIFDTASRTVRAYTTNLDGTVFYGGSSSSYVNAEDKKTAGDIYTSALPVSYLLNGGFESGSLSPWATDASLIGTDAVSGTASVSSTSLGGAYGGNALTLSAESYDRSVANAVQTVALDAGTYTFSAWLWGGAEGFYTAEAYLWVRSPSGTAVTSSAWSNQDIGAESPRLYSVTFTVTEAGSYTLGFIFESSIGYNSVSIDNAMLTEGEVGSSMTYISNGDAEGTAHWHGAAYTTAEKLTGNGSLMMTGGPTQEKRVSQTVFSNASIKATQKYLLSAWAKADSVPLHDNVAFALFARATYYDVVTHASAVVEYRADYNAASSGWQTAELSVVLTAAQMAKDNITDFAEGALLANQRLVGLFVGLDYSYNANTVYFDRIAMVYDESHASSYEYEGENVSTVTLPDGKTVEYTYTDTDAPYNPSTVTATDGTVYEFSYDEKQRITSAVCTSPDGGYKTTTSYTYDAYGNVTATETGALGTDELLYSSSVYETANGVTFGALLSSSDFLGNTTRRFYDSVTGRLRAEINPDGTGTAYTYDERGRVTAVLPVTSSNAEAESFVTGEGEVSYTYNYDGSLASVTTESTVYTFTYDAFGNRTATYAGGNLLASYTYAPNNGKLLSVNYGNGFTVSYTYDALDRIASVRYNNGSEVYSYIYNAEGNLASHTDTLAGYTYRYVYDIRGRVTHAYAEPTVTGRTAYSLAYTYDNDDRVTETVLELGDVIYSYIPVYDTDGEVTSYTYRRLTVSESNGEKEYIAFASANYTYDAFGRLIEKDTGAWTQSYTYTTHTVGGKTYTGTQIYEYTATRETEYGEEHLGSYRYEYDANGRITKVYLKWGYDATSYVLLKEYRYDAKGQLIYELNVDLNDDGWYMGDSPAGLNTVFAYRYAYDDAGNMTRKEKLAMTQNAAGEWVESSVAEIRYFIYGAALADGSVLGDALLGEAVVTTPVAGTEYTPTYDTLTYDAVGNPLTYHNAKGSYAFTWTNGRQLASVTKNGITTTYTYNKDGIRTSKTVNGVRHDYILNGSTILAELWTQNGVSYGLYFTYDEKGVPFTMEYRAGDTSTVYRYVTDAFGKITGLLDPDGNFAARYVCDGYGNCETRMAWTDMPDSTTAALNPFRYNGYYYDAETGLYYCNSRYYDAENCRFINLDEVIAGVGGNPKGYNQFAYCFNDPVNLSDANGNWPKLASIIVGAVVAVAAVAVTVATLGAAAPAAICTLTSVGMSIGASYAVASTAATVAVAATTVAAAAYAGDIAYSSITGDSILLDTVFQGNETAYNVGLAATSVATAGMMEMAAQSPGVCFVAGTLIATQNEEIPIERIEIGALVWATNPDTEETELKKVVRTFVNETDELIHITINGEKITTTPEHPFYVPQKGWIEAVHLRAGDRLQLLNNEYVVIEVVQHEILETPITVYNFEVEDFHTYYVGQSAVLVHNTCGENSSSRGVGGKGWVGDKAWRENVSTVGKGGTITSLNGGVPSKAQAMQLINQSGGTALRIEGAHQFPNPHNYSHINYVTSTGVKGTIKILE